MVQTTGTPAFYGQKIPTDGKQMTTETTKQSDDEQFLKGLHTTHQSLEELYKSPLWEEACNHALDAGEMTLGDALTATSWLIDVIEREELNEHP